MGLAALLFGLQPVLDQLVLLLVGLGIQLDVVVSVLQVPALALPLLYLHRTEQPQSLLQDQALAHLGQGRPVLEVVLTGNERQLHGDGSPLGLHRWGLVQTLVLLSETMVLPFETFPVVLVLVAYFYEGTQGLVFSIPMLVNAHFTIKTLDLIKGRAVQNY